MIGSYSSITRPSANCKVILVLPTPRGRRGSDNHTRVDVRNQGRLTVYSKEENPVRILGFIHLNSPRLCGGQVESCIIVFWVGSVQFRKRLNLDITVLMIWIRRARVRDESAAYMSFVKYEGNLNTLRAIYLYQLSR